MRIRFVLLMMVLPGCALLLGLTDYSRAAGGKSSAPKRSSGYAKQIAPMLHKYCSECHGITRQMGGINFAAFRSEASVAKAHETWERVSRMLQSGAMPPKNRPQPTTQERDLLINWIDTTLSTANCDLKDPGRVTLRRLNREEYNNTIRDLVGVSFRPADDFPADDVGYGFDNIGDVLSLSPIQLEKYLAAAERISEEAIWAPETHLKVKRFQAAKFPETGGQGIVTNNMRQLIQVGAVTADHAFPKDGEYLLRVRAYGQPSGNEPPKVAFRLDGADVETIEVVARQDAPQIYEVKTKATAGKHRFAAAFINEFRAPFNPNPRERNRQLVVDYLEIAGPVEAKPSPLPESHRRLVFVEPSAKVSREDAAKQILTRFAKRAFRRPVTADELARLVKNVDLARKAGESFERGIQLAVQTILVSPNFLFLVEASPPTNDPKTMHPLNDYQLASRMSYFLWSSMPDDELLSLAARGQLRDSRTLETQARRMIKDAKSKAFVDNFAGQWLMLRNLERVSPDRKQFPSFDDDLRAAMRTETELFFESILREDRSLLDFIDGKFTFLNDRLAQHYGIEGVQGSNFRRVNLTGDQRGGILTQASVLTVTSNPTRTSPVKRGKWILEQIFGTPPPPPPGDVPELKEGEQVALTGTLRQRMEQHRANPSCATCHQRMDPLGFGLENYDPIGAWRTMEGKFAVDASGELPSGRKFQGPAQLKTILKGQSKQFVAGLTEKMLTYSLGRGMTANDRCTIDQIGKAVVNKQYKFSALIVEIVKSEPFRMRRRNDPRGRADDARGRADEGKKS